MKVEQANHICVYTNNTTGHYKVRGEGDSDGTGGTGTGFYIHQGIRAIPYAVRWKSPSTGTGTGTPLTAGGTVEGLTGANTGSQNCGSGTNVDFQVSMQVHDILNVPAGSYSGVLKFIVQAE